ncbi:MAG: ArsR/SmtB family transcription factor [Propionibacteriaceae bacterium]
MLTYGDGVSVDQLVFRALADPTRRLLLDALFTRDGQTLGELSGHLPEMTRFGVGKHLVLLAEAGLVSTEWVGRSKRHFLNPAPVVLVAGRWISKYAARVSDARHDREQDPTAPASTSRPGSGRTAPTGSQPAAGPSTG